MLSILWQICDIIGQILIAANGQILKNKLIIWSHCYRPREDVFGHDAADGSADLVKVFNVLLIFRLKN